MILVTGCNGVLGKALIARLEASSTPHRALSSAEIDLRDAAATAALFNDIKPSVVFHLAGRVHGLMGNRRYPAEMYTDNIRINTNVIDSAYRAGARKVVAASTVATYSSDLPMPVKEDAIWDGPPHASEAAYGHAKRAMLAQLEAYAKQYGLDYAYPLLTNIYGPHDRFDKANGHVVPSLIAKFFEAARDKSTIEVWGTGVAERDFIMAKDAARALLLIGEKHTGPINVATGKVICIRDLVEVLQAHAGVDAVHWDTSKPDGQIKRRYDVTKLQALGFAPEVSIQQGIAETYDWYAGAYPDVRS
jgi:GDP-L-fucose synthase